MPDQTHPPLSDMSDDYYAAIGHVAAAWASLDLEINRAIWNLACIEQMPGACVTSQILSTRNRLAALASLVHLYGGSKKLLKAIDDFTRKSQGLVEDRNRAVHDPWMVRYPDKTVVRLHITAKDKLEFGFRPVPIETVNAIHAKIVRHVRAFVSLWKWIQNELASSRDTARKQFRRIDQTAPPQDQSNGR